MNIFRNLQYEEKQINDVIFKYGDRGAKFYIIITGQVEVFTPMTVDLENEAATPYGILAFIVCYFRDIYWQKINFGDKIRRLFQEELSR